MTRSSLDILEAVRDDVRARYADVLRRIATSATQVGRSPSEITLVGVAKRQPLERVLAAIDAGLCVIGQSYIQETRIVRPEIEASLAAAAKAAGHVPANLEWRMVGRLQSNKAGLAARLFDAIESVDRESLAARLSRRAADEGCELEVLLQVNLCGEPQKGGCEPNEVHRLAEVILELPHLKLGGLMTVPAASSDPDAARPTFKALRELRGELARLDSGLATSTLSMGMSADLEVAVEEGATLVRVGTALFGERSVD